MMMMMLFNFCFLLTVMSSRSSDSFVSVKAKTLYEVKVKVKAKTRHDLNSQHVVMLSRTHKVREQGQEQGFEVRGQGQGLLNWSLRILDNFPRGLEHCIHIYNNLFCLYSKVSKLQLDILEVLLCG